MKRWNRMLKNILWLGRVGKEGVNLEEVFLKLGFRLLEKL